MTDPRVQRSVFVLDGITDAALGGIAIFTVWYLVARAFGMSVDVTAGLWVLSVVALVVVLVRVRAPRVPEGAILPVSVPWRPVVVVGALGLGGAIAVGRRAVDVPGWWVFWAVAIAVLVTAAVLVLRARPVGADEPGAVTARPIDAGAVLAVLLVAVSFAAASALVMRPDEDDVFLVNRSVWVEDRGTFPERDTLFSDEVFAATRTDRSDPAIEPFVGVVARYTPWSAPTITYLALGPVVAFVAVLALWRLVRALRVPAAATATVIGALYLAFGGAVHTSLGNFSFGRSWQGKTVLLLVVLPLLWRHGLEWARDGRRRTFALLIAGNVAAIGCSTTALFTAPTVTVIAVAAGVIAGTRAAWPKRVAGGLMAAAIPVLTGVVALASPRQSVRPVATTLLAAGPHLGSLLAQAGRPAPLGGAGGLDSPDPWYTVQGTGMLAVLGGIAILLSWLGTRDRVGRLALVGAPLVLFGVFLAPGVLHVMADVAPSESILWRTTWIVPTAAMLGVVGASGWMPVVIARARWAGWLVAVATCVVILAGGTPIWSESNGAWIGRPAWDVGIAELRSANRLIGLAEPGTTVAAPTPVGGAVAISTVDVKAHNPRNRYLSGRWAVPEFGEEQRGLLTRAVEVGDVPLASASEVQHALRDLDVTAACVAPSLEGTAAEVALEREGFELVGSDATCRYWQPSRNAHTPGS